MNARMPEDDLDLLLIESDYWRNNAGWGGCSCAWECRWDCNDVTSYFGGNNQ